MAWSNFTFNKEEAEKQAVSVGGGFVSKSGVYTGKIKYVELVEASTGTMGINIAVETTEGSLDLKQIWTEKADGTQLGGFKTLNQIVQLLCGGNFAVAKQKVSKDVWSGSGYDQKEVTIDTLKLSTPDCKIAVYPEYGLYNGKLTTKMRCSQIFNMNDQTMMEFKLGKEASYINTIEPKLVPKYDGVTPDEVEELLASKSKGSNAPKATVGDDSDDDDLL